MSLLSMSCAIALQFSGQCPASEAPVSQPMQPYLSAVAVSDGELASVRGTGLPAAGLDHEADAGRARSIDIAFEAERTSTQTRELVDNWNVQVAASLIAQAISDARR